MTYRAVNERPHLHLAVREAHEEHTGGRVGQRPDDEVKRELAPQIERLHFLDLPSDKPAAHGAVRAARKHLVARDGEGGDGRALVRRKRRLTCKLESAA